MGNGQSLRPLVLDAVHDAVANALDAVTPAECSNYIRNSGYAAT